MIITCPACSKRYLVDDSTVAATGRQVQCVSCDNSWFFKPHSKAQDLKDVHLDLLGSKPQAAASRDISIVWVFLFLLMVAVLAGGYFAKGVVMRQWPGTQPIYKMVGLGGSQDLSGLKFQGLHPMIEKIKGGQKILLSGTIVNESDAVRTVAKLKVRVHGDCAHASWYERLMNKYVRKEAPDRCELDKWDYVPSESKIYPGERVAFETSSSKVLNGAKSIKVRF